MLERLGRIRDAHGAGVALGPLRVALGGMLLWQSLDAAHELTRLGYFGDHFHWPYLPEALVPSHAAYVAVVATRVCLAIMVLVGFACRPALTASGALGLYVLLCDRLQFHHNRYSLALFAVLVGLTPCDVSFRVVDGGGPPLPRTGPLWAVRLAQVQVSIIYLASGGSKLLDPAWRGGAVLADRIARHAHIAVAKGVPAWLVDYLARPASASALSKAAILTELALAFALWSRRMRVAALWWGVWFHLVIQLTTKVEVFSFLTVAMYAVFVTPDERTRQLRFDPTTALGQAIGLASRWLDWFARFDAKPWEPDDIEGAHAFVIVRRDGTRVTGLRAAATLARCVPILFPLWAPLSLVAAFTRKGELSPTRDAASE
ncbi:MAG: HTTM domain-containing protein [Myxococcales bacterium]|nr:HTTM domain-containing protein [Myxococcales bacterium]